jgi:hypothetical protein
MRRWVLLVAGFQADRIGLQGLGLLILVLSPEPIYGPFFLGGQNDEK